MMARILGTREFTGWHMIGVMVLFFGTIITVNMIMAYFALSSWTGLVVKNSYVESQHFNEHTEERQRMAALGWKGVAGYENGSLVFSLHDRDGAPVLADVTAKVGRPAFDRYDRELVLEQAGEGSYRAPTDLPGGIWNADVTATAPDGTAWKQSYRFNVKE